MCGTADACIRLSEWVGWWALLWKSEGVVEIMSSDMSPGPVMRKMSFGVVLEQESGMRYELPVSDEDDELCLGSQA